MMNPAEVSKSGNSKAAGDIDFMVFFCRKEHHAIDLLGLESRILNGGVTALNRKSQRAAPGFLGELCGADADDCRLTREGGSHLAFPRFSTMVAKPNGWTLRGTPPQGRGDFKAALGRLRVQLAL